MLNRHGLVAGATGTGTGTGKTRTLRLIAERLSAQGVPVFLAEVKVMAGFFGEPESDTAEFLRTAADGRGIVSVLELARASRSSSSASTRRTCSSTTTRRRCSTPSRRPCD